MSEQKSNEQIATPAELADESLENVAGGIVSDTGGGCIPDYPGGCFPTEPTVGF